MPDSVGIKTPDFGAQLQGSSKKKKNEYGPTYEQRVIDMKRQPPHLLTPTFMWSIA